MSDSAVPCTRGHRSHVKRKSQSGNHHEQLSQMALSAFLLMSRILQRTRPRHLSQFSQVIVVKPDFWERCNWYDTCCSHPQVLSLPEMRMQRALCTKQNFRLQAYRGIPLTNIVMHHKGRSRSTLKNCSRRRRPTRALRRHELFMQGAKLARRACWAAHRPGSRRRRRGEDQLRPDDADP